MCCYVGKATKIFLYLVTALVVAGLVLGFGLANRTWGARRTAPQPEPACRWPRCQLQPAYGNPPPAAATAPPFTPLTEPAVAAFPGVASSVAAPPTGAPYFGPPSPFAVGLGPSSHA